MKRLISILIIMLIIALSILLTGCKEAPVNLPLSEPQVLEFYFTKNPISISQRTVTTLIIQTRHTHRLYINNQEIPLNSTRDYNPASFNNKPGQYPFHLRAENRNGLTTERTKYLTITK